MRGCAIDEIVARSTHLPWRKLVGFGGVGLLSLFTRTSSENVRLEKTHIF
jgi:hypothetical protein